MKLHSPQFERSVKRLARRTIRSSQELRREFRRPRNSRRANVVAGMLLRLGLSVFLGVAVLKLNEITGHVGTALAGMGIYLLLAVCLRITSLGTRLNRSPDRAALISLPMTEAMMFRWLWQRFFGESLFLGLDLLVMLSVLAWLNAFPFWQWALLPLFSAGVWLYLLGLTIWGFIKLPRLPFQLLSTGLFIGILIVALGWQMVGPALLHWLDSWARTLNLILPTAWALAPFELFFQPQKWWSLIMWLPVVFVFGMLKFLMNELQAGFRVMEFISPVYTDQIPREEDVRKEHEEIAANLTAREATPRQMEEQDIERLLIEGAYLRCPWGAPRGWIEKRLWSWLTTREQALSEFVHPDGVSISAHWRRQFYILGGACLLAWIGGDNRSLAPFGILGTAAFLLLCMTLAALTNHGRAFTPTWTSGIITPIYAGYGIGYRELARLFSKQALVQLPFVVAVWMPMGGLTAWRFNLPVSLGLIFGFKLAGLLFASRQIIMVFGFSSCTNDTNAFRIRSFFILGFMIFLGLAFLGLGAASLFVTDSIAAMGLCMGALVVAWLTASIYGWFYRFSRFDLMSPPRQS